MRCGALPPDHPTPLRCGRAARNPLSLLWDKCFSDGQKCHSKGVSANNFFLKDLREASRALLCAHTCLIPAYFQCSELGG
jgi:hypothetical protein